MNKCSKLPRLVVCILFSIVCILVIARVSIATKEKVSVQAFTHKELIKDEKLNDSENTIINMLSSVTYATGSQSKVLHQIDPNYVAYLSKYLESSKGELEEKKAEQIVDMLKDLVQVMNLEDKSGMKEMSLDGREITLHMIEQIYELSGLTLQHNIQGDILRITDSTGNNLYLNKNLIQGEYLNINAILIILSVMIVLFCVCITISKKNQLFKKDEIYEFEEKGLV